MDSWVVHRDVAHRAHGARTSGSDKLNQLQLVSDVANSESSHSQPPCLIWSVLLSRVPRYTAGALWAL